MSPRLSVLLPLLVFCILSRVPSFRASVDGDLGWYLWNFSPLLAACLFSGAMYRSKTWSLAAPLATYFLGDVAVWMASGNVADAFHAITVWTYLALVAIVGCGLWLRRGERTWPRVITASLASAVAFFMITNFGSWVMDPLLPSPTGYDRGLTGLWQSYVAALPFWRNDIAAMLLFSGLFFSPLGVAALTRDGEVIREAAAIDHEAVAIKA